MELRTCTTYTHRSPPETVGFCSGHLVDNRHSVVKRAGRVKEEYQGQGIIIKLTDAIEGEVAKVGTVKWELMCCVKKNAERFNKSSAGQKGFLQIVHMQTYQMLLLRNNLPKVDPSVFRNVHEMTHEDMEQFFQNEVTWNRLIRQGRMCVHYVPLRRVKENIRHVINHRTKAFMSFGASCVKDASVQAERDVRNATMFSLTTWFPVSFGHAFNSDFHGSDYTDLESHLQMHMNLLSNAECEKVSWVINMDFAIDSDVTERLRKSLDVYGIPLTQNPNVLEQIVFQRN
ncbi:uncharacterized protein LOC101856348 isoform X2 [Aplysia californica]|uniref:Uncharacterized protein LOC101856348 isoform X2 n=1 Tax=Aplysia californica TaxID=6500 RepID=A0ABM0JRU9_APLCA|nr:uncharacterized protein LOC101856348 isoform X2 [Aplysia californica]